MLNTKLAQHVQWIAGLSLLALMTGCAAEHVEEGFEPNLVLTTKYLEQDATLPMQQASLDSTWVVTTMFGTPDDPRLPEIVVQDEELSKVVSMDHLVRASGPEDQEGRGLYRLLCASCHGVTGNGRGPNGAIQIPYPRDYRMGVFKFKSTPKGAKPTKADLKRLIQHGIAGTNMKSVDELLKVERLFRGEAAAAWMPSQISEQDVDALVDYVIYLSWRGEHERKQIEMGMLEGILEGGERLINSDFGRDIGWADRQSRRAREEGFSELSGDDAEIAEKFLEDWGYAEEYAVEIGEDWLAAPDQVTEVPTPPSDLPLAESYADVLKIRASDQAAAFDASVKRGQELFVGKFASCNKCHGDQGLGNGQTTDYDDWTKDWTMRVGIKPEDFDSLVPMLARGALPPLNSIPRNFAEGVFRGGSSSHDLYMRIIQGIDGTPMPAVTMVDGELEKGDVWHMINFIRSLQTEEEVASEQLE